MQDRVSNSTGGPWDRRNTDVIPTQNNPENIEGLQGDFIGRRGRVFGLALKAGILTILTLGFYRFWMKTRLRRWYWSAVRIGGIPAEYVGDPMEKLLGFFIAVVILAFYIGIVNLVLMFASYSLFQGNFAAYLLSFIGVIPLWFYARYRARRYVLARTRWRGIRFGLDAGAWGYAWRCMMHWLVTILTAGILWPRMTFWLEKYRTDRTWYGDLRLRQEGRWTALYKATLHIAFAVLMGSVSIILALNGYPLFYLITMICTFWLGFGLIYYRVKCWEILTNNKRAGGIVFLSRPRPRRVFWIYVSGYGLSGFVASVFMVPLAVIAVFLLGGLEGLGLDLAHLDSLSSGAVTAIGATSYFAIFLIWSALAHAFVTMPLWRHYSETLIVIDPGTLDEVHQRSRDPFSEAEGFAEALDVGAAI